MLETVFGLAGLAALIGGPREDVKSIPYHDLALGRGFGSSAILTFLLTRSRISRGELHMPSISHQNK